MAMLLQVQFYMSLMVLLLYCVVEILVAVLGLFSRETSCEHGG
jgi:hypothetical protein